MIDAKPGDYVLAESWDKTLDMLYIEKDNGAGIFKCYKLGMDRNDDLVVMKQDAPYLVKNERIRQVIHSAK